MENQDKNPNPQTVNPENRFSYREPHGSRSGRVFGGLIIITIGVIFLARQLGVDLPYWFISWPMILIAVGLYLGFRHSFRGPVWLILIAIGSIFLIDKIYRDVDFSRFFWPVLLISIGLILIIRPKKKYLEQHGSKTDGPVNEGQTADDYIDSMIIFGGVKKQVISKSFGGGKLTTIFGGTELDLTQADVNGRILLDITQIFGGTKLIVPPHWRIQSDDLVSIFGGMDDKRPLQQGPPAETNKVLVLTGTCLFGGIDIKSF